MSKQNLTEEEVAGLLALAHTSVERAYGKGPFFNVRLPKKKQLILGIPKEHWPFRTPAAAL